MLNHEVSMLEYYLQRTKDIKGNKPTIYFYGKVIRKNKLVELIYKLGAFLQSKNIQKGDNVVICLGNIPNAIISFYAVNLIGAIANVVHPLIPNNQLKNIAQQTKPKAYIMFDEFLGQYQDFINDNDNLIITCRASDFLPKSISGAYRVYETLTHKKVINNKNIIPFRQAINNNYSLTKPQINGQDIAVYMHSSGSTGDAKTAMISNSAYNYYADSMASHHNKDKVTFDETILMVLPIFHTFGLGVCMHTILSCGGYIVLMPKFNGKKACKIVDRKKCTMLAGVPNMYAKMLTSGKLKGKYIKSCYCGGDKLPQELQEEFRNKVQNKYNKVGILQGYGLTEAGVCIINSSENNKNGSIGQAVKHMQVAIMDENNQPLPPNEIGELYIAGKSLMNGYFGDDKLNSQVFWTDNNGVKWLKSGDLAYIDQQGFVFFVDRQKRLIKISGINVFPSEIEQVVYSLGFVDKCCAISVTENNKNIIKLFVVLKDKSMSQKQAEIEIRQIISKNLLKYAMPKYIIIVESLPLTDIGKVDFKKLS